MQPEGSVTERSFTFRHTHTFIQTHQDIIYPERERERERERRGAGRQTVPQRQTLSSETDAHKARTDRHSQSHMHTDRHTHLLHMFMNFKLVTCEDSLPKEVIDPYH